MRGEQTLPRMLHCTLTAQVEKNMNFILQSLQLKKRTLPDYPQTPDHHRINSMFQH